MANVEKLEATLDHIRMNREQHDQRAWAMKTECGTAMCFAGWTVALEGYEFAWKGEPAMDFYGNAISDDYATRCMKPGVASSESRVEWAAANILELDVPQARELFYHSATFDDVEQTVKDIINAEQAA